MSCPKDERRDRLFGERGWVVIRFAEEQVVRWPKNCCKTIATVVAKVLKDSLPQELIGVPDVPPVNRWTEREAQTMAAQGYRNTYL